MGVTACVVVDATHSPGGAVTDTSGHGHSRVLRQSAGPRVCCIRLCYLASRPNSMGVTRSLIYIQTHSRNNEKPFLSSIKG